MIENIRYFDDCYWVICPKCGGRLLEVRFDSVAVNITLYCKRCRNSRTINRISWERGQQIVEFKE